MKNKKFLTIKKSIIFASLGGVLAIALAIGNYFAITYETLLNVVFSSSNYSVSEKEKEVCEEVEKEGLVLLKNEDNALPLSKDETNVALFGQDSVDFVYGGGGSGAVNVASAPTLKESFNKAGLTVNETLWSFYTSGPGKNYRKQTPTVSGDGEFKVNEVPVNLYTNDVLNSLKNDDVGVVVIGRGGGESADLPTGKLDTGYGYLELDKNERDTLKLACDNFSKVVVIINSSNAMELGFLDEEEFSNVKACIWTGAVGQEGIRAIGKIFTGEYNPSGRLVDTYAYDSQSAPSFMNFGDYTITNSNVTNGNKYIVYQEGIYVGYRYYETRYEDKILNQGNAGDYDYSTSVQFPFGYGLSYTTFTWENASIKENEDSFDFTVKVTNNGNAKGKDVIEVYMQSPYTDYDKENGIEKSSVELAGFIKTNELEPGASEEYTINVEKDLLKTYDSKNAKTYVVDEGDYYFTLAKDAHEAINNILVEKDVDPDNLVGTYRNDLTFKYEVSALDTTTYSTSKVTNEKITNQFDDVDINKYAEASYLSRNNWSDTFPKTSFANGSWTAPQELLDDLEFDRSAEIIDNPNATMPTFDSTKTNYKIQDLIDAPYDDPRWDDVVNQITKTQATRLIRMGGYQTIQIDRIGLPSTIDKDGPSGISGTLVGGTSCMAWPAEVVMASTWNVELIEEMGTLMGEDSIQAGVAGWYAPGVNIHRSPYSGRNFEYYSEDGFLSGKIGASEVKGVRSKGVIAYMKHFALNDQETNRYGGAIFANEQSIREVYLKGFEYVTTEGNVTAAMAAMNRIGARWVGAHKGIMTNVLRKEWGFEGMVITDQASSSSMFYQDMISGLANGTDLWLNTNSSFWSLDAYFDNPTVMTNVHNAAKNIIYSVTKSNAVIDYSSENGGAHEFNSHGMQPWKIGLIVLDVVIFSLCLGAMSLPLISYLKNKKKPQEGK